MGEITERSTRAFYGLDADKASIPGGSLKAGDLYVASNSGFLYQWNGAGWEWPVPGLSILEAKINTGAVTVTKIGPLAVTAAKIATDAVETIKIKDLNVTAAKAVLGFGRYVPRAVAAPDKVIGDFTVDGAWHNDGLDLSGILPAGTIAVDLRLQVTDAAAGKDGIIRGNATTKVENRIFVRTQAGGILSEHQGLVFIDSNRLLDYLFTATINTINLYVVGYST